MTRGVATVVMLIAVTCASAAQAWSLRVDDAAGPPGLAERVEAAVQRWRDAGADVDAVDRSVVVRYRDAATMGPDALTLVVTGGPPGVDLEVWVRADGESGAPLDDALVVAIGIALGGTPGVGVLDPRLGTEARIPGADDVAALAAGRGLPGDVTGDGSVDYADLLALAEAWGRRGVNLPADLDGDGSVDEADLEILRAHYGFASLPSERSTPEPELPPGNEPEAPEASLDVPPADDEAPSEDAEDGASSPSSDAD